MELYHALNRGVDKRIIFLDTQDYARFVHDMFAFNTDKPASNTYRSNMFDLRSRTYESMPTQRSGKQLVDIHGWCLMHNHYHLLLSERVPGGLILFLRRLNIGYAKYFNERYIRSGTLFQGRTKKLLIDNDGYFLHILNYIHLNPLDILKTTTEWRERKIDAPQEALIALKEYRWSSYLDYSGIKNFPSILTTTLFQDVFNNNYSQQIEKYLLDIGTTDIQHLLLEKSEE